MSEPPSCDICGQPIVKTDDGQVVGHDYGVWLHSLYQEAAEENEIEMKDDAPVDASLVAAIRKGPHGALIDQVTRCYFAQFRAFFEKPVKTLKGGHTLDN